MEKKKARNGKVDLMKFLFSLVVIIYHFGNAVDYEHEIFNKGYMAVEFFFIVSGFLFAKSLSRVKYEKETLASDSAAFMLRKYKSFMPYHIFMVAVTFAYLFIHNGWNIGELAVNVADSLPDILLLQMGLVKQQSLLGHEWYISAMLIVMFVLTPIVIKYRESFTKIAAPAVSLLVLGYLCRRFDGSLNLVFDDTGFFYAGVLRALAELSLGCLCYEICKSGVLEKMNRYFLMAAEAAIYILLLVYANKGLEEISPYVVVILLAVAVTLSFSDTTSVSFLNNKAVSFLGKISFPIYLMQIVMRQIIAKIDWQYGYASHVLLYVVSVIAASLVCMLVMDNVLKFFNKPKSK